MVLLAVLSAKRCGFGWQDPWVQTSYRELPVLLEGWVLQDGNYSDFAAGSRREFALEFQAHWDRPLTLDPQGSPGWDFTGSAGDFKITGDVVYSYADASGDPGCVVIDFGYRAYSTHRLSTGNGRDAQLGDRVTGLVSLGVDPFFYFEEVTKRWPDVVELIYRWDVHRVEIDESQLVEIPADDPRYPPFMPKAEGPVYERDVEREQWREIDRTRMWDDAPEGIPLYRLRCAATGEPPHHEFRFARR